MDIIYVRKLLLPPKAFIWFDIIKTMLFQKKKKILSTIDELKKEKTENKKIKKENYKEGKKG